MSMHRKCACRLQLCECFLLLLRSLYIHTYVHTNYNWHQHLRTTETHSDISAAYDYFHQWIMKFSYSLLKGADMWQFFSVLWLVFLWIKWDISTLFWFSCSFLLMMPHVPVYCHHYSCWQSRGGPSRCWPHCIHTRPQPIYLPLSSILCKYIWHVR